MKPAMLVKDTEVLGYVEVNPHVSLIQYRGSAYVFTGITRNNCMEFRLAVSVKHVFKLSDKLPGDPNATT